MDISKMDCDAQSPIFLLGTKRSGSTLLRRIVNAHSQVTIPSPEWIFHFIYIPLYSYGDLKKNENIITLINDCLEIPLIRNFWNIKKSAEEIISDLPERSFRGVYVTLFMLYMKNNPTPFWGAKTPSNVFWSREIYSLFPKSRFIFLYRDGRDVSIDQMNAAWGPLNLYNACILWDHYTQAMLNAKKILPTERYYEIYYEKLVNNPEGEIKALCEFLGLGFESAMLEFHKQTDDPFFNQSHHLKADNPITDKYVGMYKNLPLEDKQLQTTLIGNTLHILGYEVDSVSREIGFWEKEWYIEEDEFGATITDGGPQYKNARRKEREDRKMRGVWSDEDRIRHFCD